MFFLQCWWAGNGWELKVILELCSDGWDCWDWPDKITVQSTGIGLGLGLADTLLSKEDDHCDIEV